MIQYIDTSTCGVQVRHLRIRVFRLEGPEGPEGRDDLSLGLHLQRHGGYWRYIGEEEILGWAVADADHCGCDLGDDVDHVTCT